MAAKMYCAIALAIMASSASAQEPIRDPFATLSNQPDLPETAALSEAPYNGKADSLKLKAILWSDRPLANISGMIVAPGDRVHDYTVLQLSRKTAVLRRAEESILLVLEEDS